MNQLRNFILYFIITPVETESYAHLLPKGFNLLDFIQIIYYRIENKRLTTKSLRTQSYTKFKTSDIFCS